MRFLVVLFATYILCVILNEVNAAERAVWIPGENGIHAKHPGKCWSVSLNQAFVVGQEYSDKEKCELIRCGQNLRFQKRMYGKYTSNLSYDFNVFNNNNDLLFQLLATITTCWMY